MHTRVENTAHLCLIYIQRQYYYVIPYHSLDPIIIKIIPIQMLYVMYVYENNGGIDRFLHHFVVFNDQTDDLSPQANKSKNVFNQNNANTKSIISIDFTSFYSNKPTVRIINQINT